MTITVVRLTVLGLGLVLIAGCGSAGDETVAGDVVDDGRPVSIDQEALIGSSWTLRSGGGPEGEIPQVDGWPITLNFDGETLGGTAACNDYGGSYTIEESQLRLADVGMGAAGCLPDVQESERAYIAALRDVDGIDLVGDELALSGPSTELVFGRNQPVASDDLLGALWLLEATVQDGLATAVEGEPATLMLEPGGTLAGGTGCRTLTGTFTISGNEVLLTSFAADGDCPTALFDQDSSVVSVLGDGFVPEVDGDTLVLTSAGNEGLRYRAITEDELAGLSGAPVPSDADLLDGVEWIFVGGDGPDGPIRDPGAVDGDQAITLTLSTDTYRGRAFCNAYGGDAAVGNGRLTLGVPSAEQEGCGEALDAIAAAYYDALPSMTEFGLEADGARLVASGGETELWFERAG